MGHDIEEIFARIKQQKRVTSETVTQLNNHIKESNIKRLTLWKINPPFRVLLTIGRVQLWLMAFAGLTVFPAIMYQKYQKHPEKGQILAVITPVASLLMIAPPIYFRRFYSKVLSEISYDPLSKQFILNGFQKKNIKIVKPQALTSILTKNNRIDKLVINDGSNATHNIEGVGVWESIQTFKHILDKGEL